MDWKIAEIILQDFKKIIMKHIFTIHSPITFFSACVVIFQENLAHEDVIIINDGYKVPFKIGTIVDSYQQQEKGSGEKLKI